MQWVPDMGNDGCVWMCQLVYSMHVCKAHHIMAYSQEWEKNMDGLRTRGRRLVPGGWWLVVCFFTAVLPQNAKVFENSNFEDLQVYTKVYISR